VADAGAKRFRFKPRFRGLAFGALGLGGSLSVISVVALGAALIPLATGAAGVVLGAAYLMSPAWKLEVVIDDEALEVRTPRASKFRLPWSDVKRVVAAEPSHTCFVDGGAPEKSLLVPGDGAPAPYDIENKPELYAAILAHVSADRVHAVESLDKNPG
jgi:hypothetical protein